MTTPDNDQSETDVEGDSHVASSRAGEDAGDDDGEYVGRSGSDDAIDAGESGAEARAQRG